VKLSLRSTIFIIFFLTSGVLSLSLISSQYYFSQKTADETTKETFYIIAGNIIQKQNAIKKIVYNIIYATVQNEYLHKKISFTVKTAALTDFTYLMSIDSSIASLYYTNGNKAFYEVVNIKTHPIIPKHYTIPQHTQWIVIIYKDGITQYTFLNSQRNILKTIQIQKNYLLKNRPWYQEAIQTDKVIYTKPYLFDERKEKGITYAYKFKDDNSVFAIDYTLQEINKLLYSQKFLNQSQIFLFDKEGVILASSNKLSDNKQFVDPKFLHYVKTKNKESIFKYTYNNNDYYAIYKQVNKDLYIGIRLNAAVLFAPYKQNLLFSLAIALLIVLLSIPLIIFISRILVNPINALIAENNKIKNRQFKDVKKIQTNISELRELSASLVIMAKSIDSYQTRQKKLLDSIIQLIAKAVDTKSTYTAGHCRRVPEIAMKLLEAANKKDTGDFQEFTFETSSQKESFEMAAWLHDCGKVTTPEYVIDKATKLETIYNRIHEIRTRFEVLWRDTQIEYLEYCLAGLDKDHAYIQMQQKQKELLDDFTFIATLNVGKESMKKEHKQRLKIIAKRTWLRYFDNKLGLSQEELKRHTKSTNILPVREFLLADKDEHIIPREFFDYEEYKKEGFKEEVPKNLYNYGEIYNLSIERGTLTQEERYKINEHVIMSIKMLEKIPFPKELEKVPEYAGQHHERLDGKGYPKKLTEKDLSIPSRIMAIADIFEALTAADRPYKKAKKLSETLDIMYNMAKERHIDKELFKLFIEEKVYLEYAKAHLPKNQIDTIDESKYLQ